MTFRETLFSVAMGVLALVGLFLASAWHHGPLSWVGWIMVLLGLAGILVLIHRATGRSPH